MPNSQMIDMFSRYSLDQAVSKIKTPDPFIWRLLFGPGRERFHASENIAIPIYEGDQTLAQFVGKHDKAIPVQKGKKKIVNVSVPRTFESKEFDADELADYNPMPGNIWVGDGSQIVQNANTMILSELDDLRNRVTRRQEQMACSVISNGKISVSQDNVAFEIDYGFVNDRNLITLGTNDKWDTTTGDPSGNILEYAGLIMERCDSGADYCILHPKAANALINNEKFMKKLDNLNYRIGSIDLTNPAQKTGIYIGTIHGVKLYSYNQKYAVRSGNSVTTYDMIGSGKAVFINTQNPGFRTHYAPIMRIGDSNQLEMYNTKLLITPHKSEDRTKLTWDIEQKSLPAAHEPDAIISVQVVAA
jgi:hypothetical protein